MTILVPIMLFGWVPFSIFLFQYQKPQCAVLITVIGGWLFLPVCEYNFPGLPSYGKNLAIALGLILGSVLAGGNQRGKFSLNMYDLPMLIWCLVPIVTSLNNGLGLYNGMSTVFKQCTEWGMPYFTGRWFFSTVQDLRSICIGIVVGGLLYVPLCLFEVRMSPQLSNIFYGFFPHSFAQHVRYGGFRPIVFMHHGLMVSFWMSISAMTAFVLWRSRLNENQKLFIFGPHLPVLFLLVTTVLCKSVNGLFVIIVGIGSFYAIRVFRITVLLLIILLAIPTFMGLRLTGNIDAAQIELVASNVVGNVRIESLSERLEQENLLNKRAEKKLFFGWGGYGRNLVLDEETGVQLKRIDSLWLITYSTFGIIGLCALYIGMLINPWQALCKISYKKYIINEESVIYVIILCTCVILFMIDCLVNGMINPVFIMASGALGSFAYYSGKEYSEIAYPKMSTSRLNSNKY